MPLTTCMIPIPRQRADRLRLARFRRLRCLHAHRGAPRRQGPKIAAYRPDAARTQNLSTLVRHSLPMGHTELAARVRGARCFGPWALGVSLMHSSLTHCTRPEGHSAFPDMAQRSSPLQYIRAVHPDSPTVDQPGRHSSSIGKSGRASSCFDRGVDTALDTSRMIVGRALTR